ncbi:hypothetical protein ACHAWC_000427 [Mediolabrus comicus]
MKFSTTFLLCFTTQSSRAFTVPSSLRLRTQTSPLRVSSPSSESSTTKKDLAKDFEDVAPSDVLPGGAKTGQAEVVLVGCGAPNRGMGWYHAIQMLEGR